MLCIACSIEENEDNLTEVASLEIVQENYKEIFTTSDSKNRGSLAVTLTEDSRSATADLIATGEVVRIFTYQVTDLGTIKEISFISNNHSFTMTTGKEDAIMEIDAVIFRGTESSILVRQNTERSQLSPVVGAYTCVMCPAL